MHLHLFSEPLGYGQPAGSGSVIPTDKDIIFMATSHHALIIVGSLRKQSFSLKIAHALAKMAPDTLKLSVVTLHELGLFSQDLEANPPAEWIAFRDKIKASDGVLFITPEYNRSISGVLKNAIDIASRPYG